MGTNEQPADRTGDEGSGTTGNPYGGYTPYPPDRSYSGYREGVHGEPVPDTAYQDPGATSQAPYPGSTAQYPASSPYPVPQYPANQYPAGQDPYAQGGYGSPYPPQYGAYPQYGYAVPRPTNGMAVASMVLGILWLGWLGSLLALIFGYIARQQIRERGESGDGMAVAGIVLGWIGAATFVMYILFFLLVGVTSGFS